MSKQSGKRSGGTNKAPVKNGLVARLWSERDWKHIKLDRYKIEELLGDGGMGRVFLARDVVLQRNVATKLIPEALDEAKKSGQLEQFLREAQAVAKLEHPNIVRVYDVVHCEGVVAIAMEYVSGGTLGDLIKADDEIPIPEVCRIVAEAADGLQYAHEHNMIHRDVKPANLMLTDKRQCKVVDFGATHDKEQKEIAMFEGKIIGSPHFISPEVIRGRAPTARSDIYGLGIVLWCSLLKHPPFTAETRRDLYMKHIKARLPDIRQRRPDIPPALKMLIGNCLKKKPDNRIDNCGEIAEILRDISEDFVRQQHSDIAKISAAVGDTHTTTRAHPVKKKTSRRKQRPRRVKSHATTTTTIATKAMPDDRRSLARKRKKKFPLFMLIGGLVLLLIFGIVFICILSSLLSEKMENENKPDPVYREGYVPGQ